MSRPPQAAPPELPGYRFLQNIGAGGNARVYLYEQDLPRRKVAVKVLNESGLTDEARRRFTAEANVTAGLAHRHIVQVFDARVTPDGRPYLVMPYYPQPNLSVRARRAHFTVADVLRIGIQIGSAVETSHRNDVLHRDIKPQNILTDSYGEPALTDFGIATRKGGDGPEGLSVPWSPPEALSRSEPGDERSDVYSLGATLWHLLVGRSPFEEPGGDNSTTALAERIRSVPVSRTGRAEVPESLERLLRRAMAKDPAGRPQSALELIYGLQAIEQELHLPLTQPILPAVERTSGTVDGDTIARAPSRGAVDTSSANAAPRDSWTIDAARPAASQPPVTGQPPAVGHPPATGIPAARTPGTVATPEPAQEDTAAATVMRAGTAQQALTPEPAPAATEDLTVRRQRPSPPPRVRQLPPELGVEEETVLRPATAAGASVPVAVPIMEPSRRGGFRAFALGSGLAVAAAVVIGLLVTRHPGGQGQGPAQQPTVTDSTGSALGPDPTAPGVPVVHATRPKAGEVRFTWTYANPKAGDAFDWQRQSGSGPSGGRTAEPALDIHASVATCITVRVVRADGEASAFSGPACSP